MDLVRETKNYLYYCEYQKKLDSKTLRAYKNDLSQFLDFMKQYGYALEKRVINAYIIDLHNHYKQRSVKRKIASIKALFSYLESEDIIENNIFHKIKTKFKEEMTLPKTISRDNIEKLLRYLYQVYGQTEDQWRERLVLRDIAVVEVLFATGLRISELCGLKDDDFILVEGILKIKGKGAKERYIQIANNEVIALLIRYKERFGGEIEKAGYFFVNRYGNRLSEQSARRMLNKYAEGAGLPQHVTPHMFRHSFATLLLEEDVDIRYIQRMLGHSSIVTTQIYTYVTSAKQKEILRMKHPRNKMVVREKGGLLDTNMGNNGNLC